MQLEEAKRRLMMVGHNSTHLGHNSTHMGVPPQQQQLSHSNNSTLRKSSATTGTEFTVAGNCSSYSSYLILSVISSDPPRKDCHARFTTVTLNLNLNIIVKADVFFYS